MNIVSPMKKFVGIALLLMSASLVVERAHAETVLYAFKGGSDGFGPGGLFLGADGNLYGATGGGGGGTGCNDGNEGCGTIFSLTPHGQETVLYAFQGGNSGGFPSGRPVADGSGNLYGNAGAGGTYGQGVVYALAPNGTESVLYAFTGTTDGGGPQGDLIIDKNGNLYGVTVFDGDLSCLGGQGCGTVFEVSSSGSETTLYTFEGGTNGAVPLGGVIRDNAGNIYGTTAIGGTGNGNNCGGSTYGCGTVFTINSSGAESVLYSFQGGSDGFGPDGSLLMDSAGNLYGTTQAGGGTCASSSDGCGTVYKLAPDGTETVLHSFQGGDGDAPLAGLIMDNSGNLYGTTYFGGGAGCAKSGHIGCGTVFKLAPDGTETVLFAFKGSRKGSIHGDYPNNPLLMKGGVLYGTTSQGGEHKDGIVFRLKK